MNYGTIVIDPPWKYTNDRGTQTRSRAGRSSVTAEGNYPTMDNSEIAALPVEGFAADACALYLWVTVPRLFGHVNRLRDAMTPIDMVEGWGFRCYITLLTWVKTGPPGMGFHFRGHTEHVIYAVKGDVRIPAALRTDLRARSAAARARRVEAPRTVQGARQRRALFRATWLEAADD